MEKLELLNQFIRLYGSNINPQLTSVQYCQNEEEAMIVLQFKSGRNPVKTNLDFIMEIEKKEEGNNKKMVPLFDPRADIVDNSRLLLQLDTYSLINCIDCLFTEEAASKINDEYLNNKNH